MMYNNHSYFPVEHSGAERLRNCPTVTKFRIRILAVSVIHPLHFSAMGLLNRASQKGISRCAGKWRVQALTLAGFLGAVAYLR